MVLNLAYILLCGYQDSNLGPAVYKTAALPTELYPQRVHSIQKAEGGQYGL